MKNKEMIIEAVNNYDPYTATQREMLKALINIAIDGIADINPTTLSKLTKLGRGIIYYNLSAFEEEGTIKKLSKTKKLNRFQLNENKLNHIVQVYQNKQNYLSMPRSN